MHNRTELQKKIQAYLPLHGARAAFMMKFVMAVVVVRGVTASTVASVLNPRVLLESNEKRIGCFFREVELEGEGFAKLMLALLPEKSKLVLTLDRTTWELGSVCINILMLGVAYKGLAFPLLWVLLDKKGNSDTEERLALVDKLLTLVAAQNIEAIVADREFTGKRWFKGLRERQLVFVMRVRNNTRISSKGKTRSAQQRYDHLGNQEVYICPKRCWVFGLRLYVAVTKSKEGELVVLVCNAEPDKALLRYSRRWQIETLFSALKTRGFNLEDTHMTRATRLSTLLALLSLAFAWAHLVGEWCYEQRPLKPKAHGYLPKSFFRRGLDALRSAILAGSGPAKISLDDCLKLLSP
ncbi:IS4-like element ISLpn9 family transposase [soil metagenome]